MSSKTFRQKRSHLQNEKRLEKLHYRIIIVLMVAFCLYYVFLRVTTIGHDNLYAIYVFWLPELTGIAALGWYRRKAISIKLAATKDSFLKLVTVFFYLLQGVIFSYLTFGFAAEAFRKQSIHYARKWLLISYKLKRELVETNKNYIRV